MSPNSPPEDKPILNEMCPPSNAKKVDPDNDDDDDDDEDVTVLSPFEQQVLSQTERRTNGEKDEKNPNGLAGTEIWDVVLDQAKLLRDSMNSKAKTALMKLQNMQNNADHSHYSNDAQTWDAVIALVEHIKSDPAFTAKTTLTPQNFSELVADATWKLYKEKKAQALSKTGSEERHVTLADSTNEDDVMIEWLTNEEPVHPVSPLGADRHGARMQGVMPRGVGRSEERRGSISDGMVDMKMFDELRARNEKPMPRYIIHPSHPARVGWDVASLNIVLIDSVIMPYEMAYRENAPEHAWFWFGTFFFAVDIIINFFTGFIAGPLEKDHGQLVTSPKRIAKYYLTSWFLIDFASTVPWSWAVQKIVGDASNSAGSARMAKVAKLAKLARFMRLARMLKLLKLQSLWENFESLIGSVLVVHILQLLKVLVLIAYMCHWNACIWWAIGNPDSMFWTSTDIEEEVDTGDHWTTVVKQVRGSTVEGIPWELTYRWYDRSEAECYVFCFYWTLGVMRTMPVEVYPTNPSERTYVLCFMFFAFSVFSICITKMTQMFTKINARRVEFDENMAALKAYMHEFDVDKELREKIKNFLEFKYLKRQIFAREQSLLPELSDSLRAELHFAKVGPVLRSLWVFNTLRDADLMQIVLIAQVVDAAPGDAIASKGAIAKCAILLISGSLTTIDPHNGTPSTKKKRQEREKEKITCVDVDSLLFDKRTISESSIWASDYCEFIEISKEEFLEVKQMHPEVKRHIEILLSTSRGAELIQTTMRRLSFYGLEEEMQDMNKAKKKVKSGNSRVKLSTSRDNAETAGAVMSAVG